MVKHRNARAMTSDVKKCKGNARTRNAKALLRGELRRHCEDRICYGTEPWSFGVEELRPAKALF